MQVGRRTLSVVTGPDTGTAPAGTPDVVWSRGRDRMFGWGEALRLEFSGPDRGAAAADAWREIVADARIDDGVRVPGSGLVAFGAFTFAASSVTTSVLIVPEVVVGRRGGTAFRTVVGDPEEHPEPVRAGRVTGVATGRFSGDAYRAAVAEAVRRIGAGTLQKVVLSRDLEIATDGPLDLAGALATLRRRYRDAWTYAVDGFFGASPETLVATNGQEVTARVLAGTIARGTGTLADTAAKNRLLDSLKDRREHALAVDSLLIALAPHVVDLEPGRPFALSLPNVWHLATDVVARRADTSSILDLVAALHPTAAVAGVPTDTAMAAIDELEPSDRGRYAGPVGWVDADGDGEWAIGLRGAQIESDRRIRAFAGAGIVAASDPASELSETGWKFAPILEALGLDVSAGAPPRS